MSGTPGNTSGYGNTGFNGGGLSNYNGQQQNGNVTAQPYYTGNQTQSWDPRQTVGWGDQRLSVGGPAPGPNMDMALRNAPNAPPWLQQQMAGYYAAPFMTANGTSDFPRWGQSPMTYNNAYAPGGSYANNAGSGQGGAFNPAPGYQGSQAQMPTVPTNPYSPTQSAPNAPAPPATGHPASRTQPLPVSMGDPGGGPFSAKIPNTQRGPSSGEATTPGGSASYWAAIANAALPGVQQGQRLPAWLTGGLNDARQMP